MNIISLYVRWATNRCYSGRPHDDLLRERFSVGLGFQIFNSGSTKLKMEELKLEQEELSREFARETQQQQIALESLSSKLQREALKFKAKLMEAYLEYLKDSGQLCGDEFTNFLSVH